jgi:hypothetical protein
LPRGPTSRDIVSSRKTERGDAVTVERSPRWPVWITAFDGEDEVGLGFSVKDAMWLMAALQVAIDGPLANAKRPSGPPRLELLQGGPNSDGSSPQPRRGPLGLHGGRPRPVPPSEGA